MKQIAISDETYAKLLRVGELTHQDPQAWADVMLARLAEGMIQVIEKRGEGGDHENAHARPA